MYNRRLVSTIFLIMLVSLLLVATPTTDGPQPNNTMFVIADWDYPNDEYGQGILGFDVYENSTGSWVKVYRIDYDNASLAVRLEDGIGIKLRCWARLNATLTNAATKDIGKNYLRHSIAVTNATGAPVFNQQNFTFGSALDEAYGMYIYGYDVVFGFLPVLEDLYTVSVEYEVYYDPEESTELDSDTSPTWGGIWTSEGSDGTEDNLFYSIADDNDDEDGAIETGITVNNDLGTVTFNLDLTITAYNEQCVSIDFTVMLWSGIGSGSEEIVYSDSLSGTGAVNVTGSTSLSIIESFLVNITYVGVVSGDYVNMTIDSYFVGLITDYDWNTVSETNIYFTMPIMTQDQQWAYDTLLIILGLVMIPVSTIYLAYGVKHDRSSNRLFYGLIIFFLGCGLFIGGVLP